MPTAHETTVQGYASCWNPRCPGYEQEEVPVLRRETLYDYRDRDPTSFIPGTENSTVAAVDQSVSECPHCHGPRIAALEKRPEYAPISGQHPLALLDLNNEKLVRETSNATLEQRAEIAEMRAQMAEMQLELQRRRGGRPPKEPGGE